MPARSAPASARAITSSALKIADQAVRFLDRALERGAIGGGIVGAAQRRLGVIAQPGQRRAQIVGDVVGDFAQARHQVGDARRASR